jgi:2-dehydro-3-deoxygluconokinase
MKRGAGATLIRAGDGHLVEVPTHAVGTVVDTTAAGDSFGAGYVAARLGGADPRTAAGWGNRLAARVIQHPGALIPREAMADLMAGIV